MNPEITHSDSVRNSFESLFRGFAGIFDLVLADMDVFSAGLLTTFEGVALGVFMAVETDAGDSDGAISSG